MNRYSFILISLFAVIFGSAVIASAQDLGGPPPNAYQRRTFERMMSERRAKERKKDFEERVQRAEAAVTLSEKLERSLLQHQQVTAQDAADLRSLEKLVSKILDEMGGDDDDSDKPNELSFQDAVKFLHSATVDLADEVQKTTRFSISVAAIKTSNAVLKTIKFLRHAK
jgi:hypothetical protein